MQSERVREYEYYGCWDYIRATAVANAHRALNFVHEEITERRTKEDLLKYKLLVCLQDQDVTHQSERSSAGRQ